MGSNIEIYSLRTRGEVAQGRKKGYFASTGVAFIVWDWANFSSGVRGSSGQVSELGSQYLN